MVDCGRVLPKRSNERDPVRRSLDMAAELVDVVRETRPTRAAIEIPSGKVHKRRHGGQGAGLSVYGMAAGIILVELRRVLPSVGWFTELDWTGGRSKRDRWPDFVVCFPHLADQVARVDPGGDVADAALIAIFELDRLRVASATSDTERG